MIEKDLGATRAVTIFLGDYIDRGSQSAQVLSRFCDAAVPTPFIALRGNHEQMMLDTLADAQKLDFWRRCGGLETLASYGIDVSEVMRGLGYDEARNRMETDIPATHWDLLNALPHSYALGDYFFCHAGVRPGLALNHQASTDLLWIREEFLDAPGPYEKVIVHGHTPVPEPEDLGVRINIDTGAYATGQLTCLVLEGETRRFLST